jgi:S-(hydroxymethyl)mycothiol dehydrogenase
MPHHVRGVVARTRGAPVEVVTVLVPDPGPDEVLIRVEACGVCHTDLHYREGGIGDGFPFLLGHEAAGKVETVGAGVTNVAGRCRRHRMARSVRDLPELSAGPAVVLLRQSERAPAHDPG